jgi:hypothetical protein
MREKCREPGLLQELEAVTLERDMLLSGGDKSCNTI